MRIHQKSSGLRLKNCTPRNHNQRQDQQSLWMEWKRQVRNSLLTLSAVIFTNVAGFLEKSSVLLRDFIRGHPAQQNHLQTANTKLVFSAVNKSEIYRELKSLKWRKSTGLDNFPSGLLKDAALVIAKPLTFIINLTANFHYQLISWVWNCSYEVERGQSFTTL